MRYSWVLILFLVSCQSRPDESSEGGQEDEVFVAPDSPDHDFYVDDALVANVSLEFGEADSLSAKPVLAKVNGDKCLIRKYEGTLMEASGNLAGYILRLAPYHEYDYETETEIKSNYDFYLDLQISKEQNKVLGYVTHSEETHNLEWDYFENLFEVFYYEQDGKNYPLKFIDHGKTDWDG